MNCFSNMNWLQKKKLKLHKCSEHWRCVIPRYIRIRQELTLPFATADPIPSWCLTDSPRHANCGLLRPPRLYPAPNESRPHLPTLSSILMQSSYLRTGLLCGLFPSGFATKTVSAFLMSSTSLLLNPPWTDHHNNISRTIQTTQLLIIQFSPASSQFQFGPNAPCDICFANPKW